jgi:hypothetical protein
MSTNHKKELEDHRTEIDSGKLENDYKNYLGQRNRG